MTMKKAVGAVSLAVTVGLGLGSMGVYAQNSPSPSEAPQANQDQSNGMVMRVRKALHSDAALNDKHILVSMQNGKIVMSGFVNSAGDLQKARTAANKAAGEKNVVDKLTIKREPPDNNTST